MYKSSISFIIRVLFVITAVIAASTLLTGCSDSECSWSTGKWKGKLDTKMREEYTIRIRNDRTCSIKSSWYWGEYRSADFEAEWEPVSDDIIKIYDYDGHDEKWNGFNGLYHRRTGRWSMYLKSNGAFSHDQSSLNNPDGYLEKQ